MEYWAILEEVITIILFIPMMTIRYKIQGYGKSDNNGWEVLAVSG
jgi:hypothetical protein